MSRQRGEREQGTPPGTELQDQNSQCRLQCKETNKRKGMDAHESRTEHCGMIYNNIIDIANLWQRAAEKDCYGILRTETLQILLTDH